MDPVYGDNPPGMSEAEAGAEYVQAAIEELESLERDLPQLQRMEWRSEAADEFAEFLHGCVSRMATTVRDFEAAAEVLVRYAGELRLLNAGDS
ncbi:hypothetical protein QNO08_16540 [Arthrobacter sp. zg-Y820]|uniref:hypothetical protein n=1 Tax=unclassified Arthrobacter TaxID=235627 RepID=UPI001E570FDF|nr:MULTISPECIES: hypothetical protein [unclassified Arthrobacter]MCC9197247.1 hypothetical protein [Arthrobacter sp. zg-Y820]MDK1280112.1 hypothetical protein [Arthrobacter sp. zg.Y820]WIB09404.1 hypothetical protein QNO08_16540 [Arthrobacter sp. zg-Y820]